MAAQSAVADPDGQASQDLAAVSAAVDETGVDGVAWYTDADTDQVVVTADSTVTAAEREKLRAAAGSDADALTVKQVDGTFRPLLGPSDRIFGADIWCSVGFNVRKGDTRYLLTSGHCGDQAGTWYADKSKATLVGPTITSSYPGNDYALVRYDNTSLKTPGWFTAERAHVNQKVTRNGSTTGPFTGTVEAVDVTVKYDGGATLHEMIQTDICAEPGDSGGPLYSGNVALGLTSGGSGECPTGGTSFYQPILEVLADLDVRIY